MLTKKFKLLILIVILAIIGLAVASLITIKSIEDAKTETEAANLKIVELNDSLNALESTLDGTRDELSEQNERIKKYQEILNAWSKATPDVNEAVERITVAYEEVATKIHLYPADKTKNLEEEMMDALYGAIRSTDPLSIAKNFEAKVKKLNETRYDNIIRGKIEKINQNGITFPEDTKAVSELREYYNSFLENAAVINSFKEKGIDKELEKLEALLDKDEENDLAQAFEKAVAAIKTPILPTTSLTKANDAWNAFCASLEKNDTLSESTQKAQKLLESYTARVKILIDLTNTIRAEIDRLNTADPNVTHEEIATLNKKVNELLALEVTINVLNTDKTNYVALLDQARLIPHKNDAFAKIKNLYDAYYKQAQGDRDILVALVEVKDDTFNAIQNAKSTDEIKSLTEKAATKFAACFK